MLIGMTPQSSMALQPPTHEIENAFVQAFGKALSTIMWVPQGTRGRIHNHPLTPLAAAHRLDENELAHRLGPLLGHLPADSRTSFSFCLDAFQIVNQYGALPLTVRARADRRPLFRGAVEPGGDRAGIANFSGRFSVDHRDGL